MVGLDIFFLAFISGASMNPARSLAPALLSGVIANLWLYWIATFIGSAAIAFVVCKKSLKMPRQSRNKAAADYPKSRRGGRIIIWHSYRNMNCDYCGLPADRTGIMPHKETVYVDRGRKKRLSTICSECSQQESDYEPTITTSRHRIHTVAQKFKVQITIAYVVEKQYEEEQQQQASSSSKPIAFVEAIKLAYVKNPADMIEYYGNSLLRDLDSIIIVQELDYNNNHKERYYEHIEKEHRVLWSTIYEIIKAPKEGQCWCGVTVAKTEPILYVTYCINKEHEPHPLEQIGVFDPSIVPSFLFRNDDDHNKEAKK
jgi:Major intrinsic protein